eukprot:1954_1
MAKTFEAINHCLGEYYSSMGDDTYYDDDNKLGKFLFYCTENGLEETDLQEELEENDAEDCMYLEFAQDAFGQNRFPFHKEIEDEQQQMEQMHSILQYIYRNNEPPKCIKEIADFELEVTTNDTQKTSKLYQSQVFQMLGALGLKDSALMELLTIGVRNNDLSFLNSIVDSYSRDCIAAANDKKRPRKLHVHDWVQNNTFLKALHQKNESKVLSFTGAVNSYLYRIVPKLQMEQLYHVRDDIQQIAQYIVIGTHLIQHILNDPNVTPPFMMDMIVAAKATIEVKDGSDLPDLGDDTDTESDDDDEDDHEDRKEELEEEEEKGHFSDKIGNIDAKLSNEKLVFVTLDIDPHTLGNTVSLTRQLVTTYRQFKKELEPQNVIHYPSRQRFNVVIDRRNGDNDSWTFFDPPGNCNQMPNKPHVPEWYFSASRQCLIPSGTYDAGKGNEDGVIHALSQTNGQVVTLSFHVEAADQIKCYLIYEGQTARFYAQDILEVFPKIFDMEYRNNAQFIKSDEAKEIAQNILITDVHFETFYRSFGNDIDGAKIFPKYVYKT